MPVPDPHVLTAAEVPAVPHPALICEVAPTGSTVHRSGPCTAVGFQQVFNGTYYSYVTRTTNVWSAGRSTDVTQERWGNYPAVGESDYNRTSQHRIYDANGRLFETVGADDHFQSPDTMYSESTRTVIDYAYDAGDKLASSTTRARAMWPYQSPDQVPENKWWTDLYFVDARGTAFLRDRILFVGTTYSLGPNDFTVYPDGMVKTAIAYLFKDSWGSIENIDTSSFDESGLLLEHDVTAFDRFGRQYHTSSTYEYSGGRITNVVTVDPDEKRVTTVYTYDAAGNNVARVETDASGSIKSSWTGIYDRGGNLVCESTADDTGALSNIVHYDYSCF